MHSTATVVFLTMAIPCLTGHCRAKFTYGQNWDAVQGYKTKYDPNNFFRNNLNIPPCGNAGYPPCGGAGARTSSSSTDININLNVAMSWTSTSHRRLLSSTKSISEIDRRNRNRSAQSISDNGDDDNDDDENSMTMLTSTSVWTKMRSDVDVKFAANEVHVLKLPPGAVDRSCHLNGEVD